MKLRKRLLTFSLAVIVSCQGNLVLASDISSLSQNKVLMPEKLPSALPNTTFIPGDEAAPVQNNTIAATQENPQLLFPIDDSASKTENTQLYRNKKEEYVKPEIKFVNVNTDSLANAVTNETEKEKAKMQRAMTPDELGYDADSIIVSYKQKDNTESIAEMCRSDVAENGDESAEELMGTEDRKIIAINLNDNKTVETAIEEYQAMDGVVHAQPNYIYYTAEEAAKKALSGTAATADDPARMAYDTNAVLDQPTYDQWYLDRVHAEAAWDFVKSRPHQKVRVCVLDTGCEITHTDLQKTLNVGLSKEIFKTVDDNYSFYPLIGEGYYKGMKGNSEGHGTMVTGVLGATASNNFGIKGIASCYDDDVLDTVVLDVFEGYNTDSTREVAYTKTIIQALNYALSIDAQVVNLSLAYFGKGPDDLKFEDACNNLYNHGIVIVAAAGNIGTDAIECIPGDFESVISVIATDKNNNKVINSAYGAAKDLCAPGAEITTTSGLSYKFNATGTSFSAPLVTGTVAMMLSINPKLKPSQVKSILCSTTTDLGTPGKDNLYANGLLNAGKAVQASPLHIIGIYPSYFDRSVLLSCAQDGASSQTKYRWEYCVVGQSQWRLISDWSTSSQCTWYPDANESYVVVCRISYFGDGITTIRQDWTVSRPQMTASIDKTYVQEAGDSMLLGCIANTDQYYTALYIYSYATNSWIVSACSKGSSCWYRTTELSPGTYMAYFCTEDTEHGRKLSTSYRNFAVE